MAQNSFILTTHARERLSLRHVSMGELEQTLRNPSKTYPGEKPETVKFIRFLNGRQIQVVGKYLPDQGQWLVLSVWARGEDDPVPVVWQLIALPFKVVWWLVKWLATHLVRSRRTP